MCIRDRVYEEHGPLLARLACKAQMGFDHKLHVGRLQAVGQCLPVVLLQDQTEVRHRHQMLADMACQGGLERFTQVQGNLVREKVKVHPGVGGSTLFATKHAAIKAAGFVEVGDVKSEVKEAVHARKHISHLEPKMGLSHAQAQAGGLLAKLAVLFFQCLAIDAALCGGIGVEPSGRNADATVGALAVGSCLNAFQCGFDVAQLGGLVFVHGELALPLGLDSVSYTHLTATIASGGRKFAPRVVRATQDALTHAQAATTTTEPVDLGYAPEHIAVVRNGLVGVVTSGTSAQVFAGAAYQSAGKTGTAQAVTIGHKDKYNAVSYTHLDV